MFNDQPRRRRRSAPTTSLAMERLEPRCLLAGDYAFAVKIGSTNIEVANSIVADAQGNSYVTGEFRGTVDFDPGVGTRNLSSAGGSTSPDAFIAKYDPAGSLLWAYSFGGTGLDWGTDIALAGDGSIWVVGTFTGVVDFDPSIATASLDDVGASGGFILKLDAGGNYQWAGSIDSLDGERLSAIAVDATSNVFVTGQFNGTADFDPSAQSSTLTSAKTSGGTTTWDAFLTKLAPSGEFQWARAWGGNATSFNGDWSKDVAVDPQGNPVVFGIFLGAADLDPGPGNLPVTAIGNDDAFVSEFNADGDLLWARVFAGGTNFTNGIAVDSSGNVYTTGGLQDTTDFDPGAGVDNHASPNGWVHTFLSKLDANGNYVWAKQFGGPGANMEAWAIAVDDEDDVYLTGQFGGTNIDIDTTSSTMLLSSLGGVDTFVARINSEGTLVSARSFGGTALDRGRSISVNAQRDIFVAGQFHNTVDFDPDAATQANIAAAGQDDAYLIRLTQSQVGGFVWTDADGDGLRGDEPGIAGVAVDILLSLDAVVGNTDDRWIGRAYTGADGSWQFTSPQAGLYYAKFELPTRPGLRTMFAVADAGDDALDSDVLTLDGRTAGNSVQARQTLATLSAGVVEFLTNDWHNAIRPADVDGQSGVTPLDALLVINELNSAGSRQLRVPRPPGGPTFWDVNDDLFLTPLDALLIINELNAGARAEGEGPLGAAPTVQAGFDETGLVAWWQLQMSADDDEAT